METFNIQRAEFNKFKREVYALIRGLRTTLYTITTTTSSTTTTTTTP